MSTVSVSHKSVAKRKREFPEIPETPEETQTACQNEVARRKRRRRHIPHAQRPSDFVEKRNGRERRRVGDINSAFQCLKDRVPFITRRNVRTSKMKILTNAIDYIEHLSSLLNGTCGNVGQVQGGHEISPADLSCYNFSLPSLSQVVSPDPSPSTSFSYQSDIEMLEDRIPPILNDHGTERTEILPFPAKLKEGVSGSNLHQSSHFSMDNQLSHPVDEYIQYYGCDSLLSALSFTGGGPTL